MVVVDDYLRWTWVTFLAHKNESFEVFFKFCKRVQNENGVCITSIKRDHGEEFENESFHLFCEENGIFHNLTASRTPQQKVLLRERINHCREWPGPCSMTTLPPKHLWAEAVNTSCYLQHKIYIRPILKKTPYELWKGRKPNISYFHPFGC